MSAADLINLLVGSGVLAQGIAFARWSLRLEMRVTALEKEMAHG